MGQRIFPHGPDGEAPPEYGRTANIVKTKMIDLTNARPIPERIEIGGSILWAVTATSYGALVNVRLNDEMRDPIPFQMGMYVRGSRFSRIYVSNLAQAGETITFMYASEDIGNIQIENAAAAFALMNLTKATVFNTLVDLALVALAAAVEILPANAARRVAIIGNLTANGNVFRVGDAATAAAQGQELAPGDVLKIETTEAIFAYNPGPGNENISRIWTED